MNLALRASSKARPIPAGSTASRRGSLTRVALLGAVTGLRSQVSLALLARAVRAGRVETGGSGPLHLLDSRPAAPLLLLTMAGEFVGDKLPMTPSRMDPGPLGGRLVLGALAGAVLRRSAGASLLPGVLLGALGADLGAWASYHARVWLGRTTGVADPVLGAAEDLVALGLATYALRDDT